MGNTPRVIIHLLIINVIFFFGSKVSGAISNDFLALHYFENDKFIISQLFTHLFMHGNEAHLFFNMFGLWMFGSTLANIWGTNKFLFFYMSSGLGAAIVQMIMYYLNIDSVTSSLLEYGVSSEIILNIGDFVQVPFGKSKLTGVVWNDFEKKNNKIFKIKKVNTSIPF